MNIHRRYRYFLIIILVGFLNACGGGSSSNTDVSKNSFSGELVSVTKLSTRTKAEINTSLAQVTTQVSALYDVNAYKVLYKTLNPQGNLITVSGLMTVPQKASNARSPRLSYQHGTIFLDTSAPSFNYNSYNDEVIASSFGYLVTSPDYIGYGASAGQIHPHTHAETLAGASIDLIRASKTWLATQNIKTNNQLFLMGYSEGGYATYAMQKHIQETLGNEFTVTASVPSASAYNLTKTKDALLDEAIHTFIFYGYIFKGLDSAYQLNQLPTMIKAPYLKVLNEKYDGKHTAQQINALLPPSGSLASDFFTPTYFNQLKQGEKTPMTDKLAENNIDDWTPTAPTRFYQNRGDELVPFAPVESLVNTLKSQGADVELIECYAGGLATTHGNCFRPSLFYSAGFFQLYAQDL